MLLFMPIQNVRRTETRLCFCLPSDRNLAVASMGLLCNARIVLEYFYLRVKNLDDGKCEKWLCVRETVLNA